jgi:hypothetical protein
VRQQALHTLHLEIQDCKVKRGALKFVSFIYVEAVFRVAEELNREDASLVLGGTVHNCEAVVCQGIGI